MVGQQASPVADLLIAGGYRVVARAADLKAASAAVERLHPEIAVVEADAAGGGAFELARALQEGFPYLSVVLGETGRAGRERLLTFLRDVTRCRHGRCVVRMERELAVDLADAKDERDLARHVLKAARKGGLKDCAVCLLVQDSGSWRWYSEHRQPPVVGRDGALESETCRGRKADPAALVETPVDRKTVDALLADGAVEVRVDGSLAGVISFDSRTRQGAALTGRETAEAAALHLARALARITYERSLGREHRRIERLLEETRLASQTLADIIDFLPDATFVIDREGKVIAWNHAVERMTGTKKADIVGKGDRAYATAFWGEPRKIIVDFFDGPDSAIEGTYSYVRREGNVLFAEAFVPSLFGGQGAHVWVTASLLFDRAGNRIGAIESVRDITGRKRTEQRQAMLRSELAASANQWRGTFDAVSTALFIVDSAGLVLRCNRAARDLIGSNWEGIVERPLASLGPGEPFRTSAALVSSLVEGGMSRAEVVAVLDGERAWSVKVARVDLDSIVVAVPEITAVVDLQRSLRTREYMAAMGALIGGVAHEVRNPLFGISSILDALDGMEESEPLRPFMDGLRREADRLTETMKALLEYGRPVSEERAPVGLDVLVSDAFRLCDPLARGSKVNLRAEISPSLPPVSMDRSRMLEVFRNVVENGIQHSPPGGRVVVRAGVADSRPGCVELLVHDSGPGFPDTHARRVFEPFFSRRPGGTGLGLSIVQRVVEAHGGDVVAETHHEGGGLLRLRLPL